MEYLAKVRDGSDGSAIVNGYWTTQVIGAQLGKNEILPLYQELYSQNAPDFKSENTQIIKAIDMVTGYLQNKGDLDNRQGKRQRGVIQSLTEKQQKKDL